MPSPTNPLLSEGKPTSNAKAINRIASILSFIADFINHDDVDELELSSTGVIGASILLQYLEESLRQIADSVEEIENPSEKGESHE